MADSESNNVMAPRLVDEARMKIARLTLNTNLSLRDVIHTITEISANTLQVPRVGVWLFINNRTAIRCVSLYERETRSFTEGTVLQVADFPAYFEALEVSRAIPVTRAQTNPLTDQMKEAYLDPLGITSLLDAPILLEGQVRGVICHESKGPVRNWSAEERDFATSMADQISLKIKSAELVEARALLNLRDTEQTEQQKQNALAQFATGVAHDLRNLLTVILGNNEMIAQRSDIPKDVAEFARNAIAAAERGNALANELSAFGRDYICAPRVISPTEGIESYLPLLKSATGPKHTLEFSKSTDPGKILIDPKHFERILMNLVVNARDAMPDGGKIRISTGKETNPTMPKEPTQFYYVEIQDEGTGIRKDHLERIFDPFFSTKPRGQGTGLGLAIVKSIVDRVGGLVKVNSTPGQGSTFRVYFPKVTCDG